MIAKAKAIAHGSKAIEYALRESKHGYLVMSNLVQNQTPGTIYKEFLQAQEWNTRCKNKFIRIEIGIAPADEKRLGQRDLERICSEFSERFGFKNHQWIACTHRDTEHLHSSHDCQPDWDRPQCLRHQLYQQKGRQNSRRHQPGYGTNHRQPGQAAMQIPAGSDEL